MIHIKYKLENSNIHGTGLFADQDISRGQVIYTSSPLLDLNISEEVFRALSDTEQREVRYWGFFDELSELWHVDFDVSKFINHMSEGQATVTQDKNHIDAYLVAVRDIKAGEELSQNYLEFEGVEELTARGISLDAK